MLEIAQNFEQAAVRFSPVVLTVPAIAAVLAGLVVWLGGIMFRRVVAGAAGAVAGGLCGLFVIGRNVASAGLMAAVFAIAAVAFARFFIIIMAAVLTAGIGFAVLVGPYIEEGPQKTMTRQAMYGPGPYSAAETVELVRAYADNYSLQTKQACSQMPIYSWLLIIIIAAIPVISAIFLQKMTSALCCAGWGTLLIFAGMISLLLYKGAEPMTRISDRGLFYSGVFAIMTVFGAIEQLLLCKNTKKVLTKIKTESGIETPQEKSVSWRT